MCRCCDRNPAAPVTIEAINTTRLIVQNTHALTVFGRTYDRLHAYKDEPAKWLGPRHRIERHAWYQLEGVMWDLDNPMPESISRDIARVLACEGPGVAESFQADVAHDCYD